jgi:hypothetical protein
MYKKWLLAPIVDLEDADKVSRRLDDYLEWCEANKIVPSYEGMSMSLNISVDQLNHIENYAIKGIETSRVVTRYKNFIAYLDYSLVLDGVLPSSIYELRAGYFSGINKKTNIELTPTQMKEEKSIDEIKKMIAESKDIIE